MIAVDMVLKTEQKEASMDSEIPEKKLFYETMLGPKW